MKSQWYVVFHRYIYTLLIDFELQTCIYIQNLGNISIIVGFDSPDM